MRRKSDWHMRQEEGGKINGLLPLGNALARRVLPCHALQRRYGGSDLQLDRGDDRHVG